MAKKKLAKQKIIIPGYKPCDLVSTPQPLSPKQVPKGRPQWFPKQTCVPKPKLPSVKSGGHFENGVWVSRDRGRKRRWWPANKKL